MIDHLGINCTDLSRAAEFYDRVLGVLGHQG
jgi:catechol 2,3-dioxygenase-like lactoylglutathione lyase family enzyme